MPRNFTTTLVSWTAKFYPVTHNNRRDLAQNIRCQAPVRFNPVSMPGLQQNLAKCPDGWSWRQPVITTMGEQLKFTTALGTGTWTDRFLKHKKSMNLQLIFPFTPWPPALKTVTIYPGNCRWHAARGISRIIALRFTKLFAEGACQDMAALVANLANSAKDIDFAIILT
jgi:hypothetical protein